MTLCQLLTPHVWSHQKSTFQAGTKDHVRRRADPPHSPQVSSQVKGTQLQGVGRGVCPRWAPAGPAYRLPQASGAALRTSGDKTGLSFQTGHFLMQVSTQERLRCTPAAPAMTSQ